MFPPQHIAMGTRIATVVMPLGVYFLVLGLLNSRRSPQLLTGRRDFALLTAAFSPLFVIPLIEVLGLSPLSALLATGAVVGGTLLLGPRGNTWVVYNLPVGRASSAVADALTACGRDALPTDGGFAFGDAGESVRVAGFPLLRNVSIRLLSTDAALARTFEAELACRLERIRTESSPMAASMLLVATAMLVVPLTIAAHRAGEIVRILTDLLR
jgi:hypothetical protein